MWLVEDLADAMRPVLAKVKDMEGLDRYQAQLAKVLRDLSELQRYLCIPAGSAWSSRIYDRQAGTHGALDAHDSGRSEHEAAPSLHVGNSGRRAAYPHER